MELSGEFVVDNNISFDSWYIKAKRVIFKSGSQLTFSKKAQFYRKSFFIVTEEMVCEDLNSPGRIIWEHDAKPDPAPASGQARSEEDASRDGSDGATESHGDQGVTGIPGAAAPQLTIIVVKVPNSGVLIDYSGQSGGQGGKGQQGGKGGHGASGRDAEQSAVDCQSGAGDGGDGGKGGTGGRGGVGGIINVISVNETSESIGQKFRFIVSGGEGGSGGPGVDGGEGGSGGKGGNSAPPYCKGDGSRGSTGAFGQVGENGQIGQKGVDGQG